MIHRIPEPEQGSPDPREWVDPMELVDRIDECPQVAILQGVSDSCQNGMPREVGTREEDQPHHFNRGQL